MRFTEDPVYPFSHFSPIYNWIYPVTGQRSAGVYEAGAMPLAGDGERRSGRARALYLHVPFCDTICTFCPLVKGPLADAEMLEVYVRAVIAEIALKGGIGELARLPIRAIFFGGGTPSLLQPAQILRIGVALAEAFDLSALEEFSVEMEAKSITPERVAAFRAIGVTHARFGIQTFSPRHRRSLNLTASIEQIGRAADLLRKSFPHASGDMLYGLHGQTGDEFVDDIEAVTGLGLDNIDFYPLNVFVVQKKLHRNYQGEAVEPLSGATKFHMTRALRELMRDKGFLPHNGHGFVRVPAEEAARNPVVTRRYAFKYHQHVYGPDDNEYIGIGNSALSYVGGRTLTNEMSRQRYVNDLLGRNRLAVDVVRHPPPVNASKAIAISLPYLGHLPLDRVRFEDLPDQTARQLGEAIDHGLVERDEDELRLTHAGWHWYVNLMFYFAPPGEQAAIAAIVMRDAEGSLLPKGTIDRLTRVA
ncbi:coproporphyrinogen-III oxidase family protein [Ciceribacter selenitireducens]|uniref:coproporphyrinogen-III oxidase family protein n=1 Tax=Ciceribacter selenitireducens TaxID=448181 RepID=UPI0004B5E9CB|nr:radical SAM protein [Ciceribacter selenitireducens]